MPVMYILRAPVIPTPFPLSANHPPSLATLQAPMVLAALPPQLPAIGGAASGAGSAVDIEVTELPYADRTGELFDGK